MKNLCLSASCFVIVLMRPALAAWAGDGSGSVLDNRGLITYYGYVRGERMRQEVQEIERQRHQGREALNKAKANWTAWTDRCKATQPAADSQEFVRPTNPRWAAYWAKLAVLGDIP